MPNPFTKRPEQDPGDQAPPVVNTPIVNTPVSQPVIQPVVQKNPFEVEAAKPVTDYFTPPNITMQKRPGQIALYTWHPKGNINPYYKPEAAYKDKPYWSIPQRVVRYKQMLDTMPSDTQIPDWLDKQKVNTLYNYLEFTNPGKKSEDWDAINPADPNYSMVEGLTSPPQDLLPYPERDPVTQANDLIDHWKKRYEDQYTELEKLTKDYNAEFADKYAEETTKQNEIDFSKMEPFQQFLVATQAITPGKNKPQWMENLEFGSNVVKTGMMASTATGLFTGALGAAGVGSVAGPAGWLVGMGAGLAFGVYATILAKSGNTIGAQQIFSLFNKPAEWTEQLLGAGEAQKQLASLGADTSKIKYKDFYEAGRTYYESNFYELGNIETDLISQAAHILNPNWSSGMTTDPGEVWQIQKGIVEPQVIREGYLVGNPLAEASVRLANGEASTIVYEDIVDRFGYSGTKADFMMQSWIDPTQYFPFLVSLAGEKISGWAKNPQLAASFKNIRGNVLADAMPGYLQMPTQMAISLYNRVILSKTPKGQLPRFINFKVTGGIFDVVNDYRFQLRTASSPFGVLPKLTDDFTGFDRLIAKIDKESGLPIESVGLDTQGHIANKRIANIMGDATPLTKVAYIKDNLTGGIENMWERSNHNIDLLPDEIGKVIAGKASVIVGEASTYFYDSPEARAVAGALKASMDSSRVKNLVAEWQSLGSQRALLDDLSVGLKITPEDILLRIEKGETSQMILDFKNSGTDVSNNAMRSILNHTLDEAGIQTLFKEMIRDKIPANPDLMFVKFSDELDRGMSDYLAKNYDVPVKESTFFRAARLNKSIQSLFVLGLNPNFLVKNFVNNISTMAYQRVGGLYTTDMNQMVYDKYGITKPARAGEGYTMIGMTPKVNPEDKDIISQAQGLVTKIGQGFEIKNAKNDKAIKVPGLAVMSNVSMKVEQACSDSVVSTGVDYVMRNDWISGKAIGDLPAPVKQQLTAQGIDPNNILNVVRATYNSDDLANGPKPKVRVQIKLNEAVEATFKQLNIEPEIGNDFITKTGMTDALTRYINDDGMTFDQAINTYQRTLDNHITQLKAEEILSTYADTATVVKNSGYSGAVHVFNQARQDEYTYDNTIQRMRYDAAEESRAIRNEIASAKTPAEKARLDADANAHYHIRQNEIANVTQQHIDDRVNALAPILNALDVEVPVQARYISAVLAEHRAYVKLEDDKLTAYDLHFDPDPKTPKASWDDVQAKTKVIVDTWLEERIAIRKEVYDATVGLFGDDANVVNKVKTWLDANAQVQDQIDLTNKKFEVYLSKQHGTADRDAAWLKRNQFVEGLQNKTLDADFNLGDLVNEAVRTSPEPVVPDVDFEVAGARETGEYIISPSGERVWVKTGTPKVRQTQVDPETGNFTNALDQPAVGELGRSQEQIAIDNTPLVSKAQSTMTYDEYQVKADVEKRLLNINRIEKKYRSGWIEKNATELSELRTVIEADFHMQPDEARAAVALMCVKAEEYTFRTKQIDPMAYVRRYQYETADQSVFDLDVRKGIASAGTGRTSLDVERGKWVIQASKKANATTWLHEMAHTWITDLDMDDMNILAKWSGYKSGDELMQAETYFRNYKSEPGVEADTEYKTFAHAQEKIVAAFEQTYYKKPMPLNELQMATASPSINRGFQHLMANFRNWIVKLYDNMKGGPATGQAKFIPANRNSAYGINISPEVEVALYHLYNGYRKDQVWQGDPTFEHQPVSMVYLDDLYSTMNGGKHIDKNWYTVDEADLQSVVDLAAPKVLAAAAQPEMMQVDEVVNLVNYGKKKIAKVASQNFGKNSILDITDQYYKDLYPETQSALAVDIRTNSSIVEKLQPGTTLYDYVVANKITQEKMDTAVRLIELGKYNPENKLQWQLMFRSINNLKDGLPQISRLMNLTVVDKFANALDQLYFQRLAPLKKLSEVDFDAEEGIVKRDRFIASGDFLDTTHTKYQELIRDLRALIDTERTTIPDPIKDWTGWQKATDRQVELMDLMKRARTSINDVNTVIDAYEKYSTGTYIKSIMQDAEYNEPSREILGQDNVVVDYKPATPGTNMGVQDPTIPAELGLDQLAYRKDAESSLTPEQKQAYATLETRATSQEDLQAIAGMTEEQQTTYMLERSRGLSNEPETAPRTNPIPAQSPEDQDMTRFANEAVVNESKDWKRQSRGFEAELENTYARTGGKGPEWEAILQKARNMRQGVMYELEDYSNKAEGLSYIQDVMFPNMKNISSDLAEATFNLKRHIIDPQSKTVEDFHTQNPNALYQPDPGPLLHNPIESMATTLKQGKTWREQAANVSIMLKTLRDNYNANTKSYGYKGIDQLTPEARALFDTWLKDAGTQLASTKQKALRYGLAQRDSALLNYGDRNGFDNYFDLLFPYQFWYTRSMAEWTKRSINRPSILALAGRRQAMAEKLGKELGDYPTRLQGKYKIPWAFAEKWMGDSVYINPWMDLMPVNQLVQPFEQLNRNAISLRPDIALSEMVRNNEISQAQMDTSMANMNDENWNKAMAIAEQGNEGGEDPYSLISMMMSPNWLISEVEGRITGKPKANMPQTNLGLTIQSHADTIGNAIGKSNPKIGDAIKNILTTTGKAFEWSEKTIRGSNFSYYGEWGPWLVKRELSNMAAEGKDVTAVQRAMIEMKGDLWAEASKRVRDEVSLKTPGSLFARTIEEGEYSNMPWAIVATLFPNGIFPEGEMNQLGLKADMLKGWDLAAQTGDKSVMDTWFKEHPEYMARAALNDDDPTMLKKFLVNQIMDAYTGEANINKSLIKAHLGDDFLNKILNPDNKSGRIDYKALDLQKLVDWARTLKREIPITEETMKLPIQGDKIATYTPEEITELTTFFDDREVKYPQHQELNDRYALLQTEKEKDIFLAKYPELQEYWNYAKDYRATHPTVKAWADKYADPNEVAHDPYFGLDPAKIQGYYDYKQTTFPNVGWLNTEYFKIGEKDYAAKNSFLVKHPELKAYWDWKDLAEKGDPEYLYYNKMQDAMYTKKDIEARTPADLKPAQVAQALAVIELDSFVKQDLLDYYVRKTELPFGTKAVLRALWEERGKPGSSFEDFVDNLF